MNKDQTFLQEIISKLEDIRRETADLDTYSDISELIVFIETAI
jgi:hypothetical protein